MEKLEKRINLEVKMISEYVDSKIEDSLEEIEFDFEIEDEDLMDAIRAKLRKEIKRKVFYI